MKPNDITNKKRTLKQIADDLWDISVRMAEARSILQGLAEGTIEKQWITDAALNEAVKLDQAELGVVEVVRELRAMDAQFSNPGE